MRFHAGVTLAFAAVQYLTPVDASISCTTDYSSKSTKHVPTDTTTTTTSVQSTITKVSTTTKNAVSTYVFTVTNTSSTNTVPTPSGFVPLTSATIYTPPADGRRALKPTKAPKPPRGARFARANASPDSTAKATTSYPHDVHCTKTVTRTQPRTTVHSTTTSTAYTKTVTSTVTVAESTIYAACLADNVLNTFHNQTIGGIDSDHGLPSCYSGHEEPCNSAYDCCVDTINNGIYSGWLYASGYCSGLAGSPDGQSGWVFYPGGNDGSNYYGNGAHGGGQWSGSFTAN